MTPFKFCLVSLAYLELGVWRQMVKNKETVLTESDKRVKDRLTAYYTAAGLMGKELKNYVAAAAADNEPWSGAFISYLFATAGAGPAFPVALAHSRYVTSLSGNIGKDPVAFPFQTWPIEFAKAAVGDVVCVWRDGNPKKAGDQQPIIHGRKASWWSINPDQWQHFPAHCDLIVEISGNQATAIGGNVSNTVKQTTYSLTKHGMIDHSRGVAIIKNYR